ncbi:unnamed protein product [Kuraishia capsulata CBS 1993]|uniref:Nitrogen permease regulator 2 n=1 Tax=Kuraishia capsulata CBS 1993 TaxID=1382522 RepID=W6MND8_9ASCO|nr:uncharacterized protein KUCA_T00002509001 [Kuraishia capsulata CBS 1993]CDK26537.1 unnamed protein product [Kuraishia capsulata CBS 1993]
MDDTYGFVPIVAMFYAVFHPTEGTKVVHQVPSGSVITPEKQDSSSFQTPLFDFDSIKNYVIPKPSLCDTLVTFKINSYRIVGFPSNIYSSQYARNSFSFNFCFVFPYESDTTPYEGQIKRMGKMFRALEEQFQILSRHSDKDANVFFKAESQADKTDTNPLLVKSKGISEDSRYLKMVTDEDDHGIHGTMDGVAAIPPGQLEANQPELSSIESLIQQIFQDLNNYSECQIPIDAANSVDIKLFPIIPPPPDINSSDVPVVTVKLDSLVDVNWDPTMLKILPYIDGINSIHKIAKLAEADYFLAKQCIQHLLHYRSVAIVDIFQFSNTYAPTSEIIRFLTDPQMASECQAYVFSEPTFANLPLYAPRQSAASSDNASVISGEGKGQYHTPVESVSPKQLTSLNRPQRIVRPSKTTLFSLYRSLHQSQTMKEWYLEHASVLKNIDIRRFVSFGVLRGIIYRVRSYPISTKLLNSLDSGFDDMKGRSILPVEKKKRSPTFVRGAVMERPSFSGFGADEEDAVVDGEDGEDADTVIDMSAVEQERIKRAEESHLVRLLKKAKDFDAICTEMGKSKTEVEHLLNGLGPWSVINS